MWALGLLGFLELWLLPSRWPQLKPEKISRFVCYASPAWVGCILPFVDILLEFVCSFAQLRFSDQSDVNSILQCWFVSDIGIVLFQERLREFGDLGGFSFRPSGFSPLQSSYFGFSFLILPVADYSVVGRNLWAEFTICSFHFRLGRVAQSSYFQTVETHSQLLPTREFARLKSATHTL